MYSSTLTQPTVHFLGTHHYQNGADVIHSIEKYFSSECIAPPTSVAVELDEQRMAGLIYNAQRFQTALPVLNSIKALKPSGENILPMSKMELMEKRKTHMRLSVPMLYFLANSFVSALPYRSPVRFGEDMLAGMIFSSKIDVPVYAVDRDQDMNFTEVNRKLGLWARMRMSLDIILCLMQFLKIKIVGPRLWSKELDADGWMELNENGQKIISRYSVLHDELYSRREENIAENVKSLIERENQDSGSVLLICGANHLSGLQNRFEKMGFLFTQIPHEIDFDSMSDEARNPIFT